MINEIKYYYLLNLTMERDYTLLFKTEEEARKKAKEDLKAKLKASHLNYNSLHYLRSELEQKKEEVDKELAYSI